MKKLTIFTLITLFMQGCATPSYENDIFPDSATPWQPINPENFGKTEAQRIFEGSL